MGLLAIPTKTDVPAYDMTVTLDGAVYLFRFRFNYRMDLWIMDIAERDGTDIVAGVAVLSSVPLIAPLRDERLPPGLLMAIDQRGGDANAGRYDLGRDVVLLYEEASA